MNAGENGAERDADGADPLDPLASGRASVQTV